MLKSVIVIGVASILAIATFCMGVDLKRNKNTVSSTFDFLLKLQAHLGMK